MKLKLKPIPDNTVVHTPSEEEAKELLGILHKNGYSVTTTIREMNMVNKYKDEDICIHIDDENWGHCTREWYENKGFPILTLAEFKERYCEVTEQLTEQTDKSSVIQEKPQPKFKIGDKVMVQDNASLVSNIGKIATIVKEGQCCKGYGWVLDISKSVFLESELAPYTEPETISTEDMEAKDYPPYLDRPKTVVETPGKELSLCELLQGHEGETFYSPVCGTDIELKTVFKSFLVFYLDKDDDCTIECETRGWQRIGTLDGCGIFKSITYPNSVCIPLTRPLRAIPARPTESVAGMAGGAETNTFVSYSRSDGRWQYHIQNAPIPHRFRPRQVHLRNQSNHRKI